MKAFAQSPPVEGTCRTGLPCLSGWVCSSVENRVFTRIWRRQLDCTSTVHIIRFEDAGLDVALGVSACALREIVSGAAIQDEGWKDQSDRSDHGAKPAKRTQTCRCSPIHYQWRFYGAALNRYRGRSNWPRTDLIVSAPLILSTHLGGSQAFVMCVSLALGLQNGASRR